MTLAVLIRDPQPDDRPAILDAWQKSVLGQSRRHPHGTGALSQVRRAQFFAGQERVIDAVFRHPGTVVRVAEHLDEHFIVGWVCGMPLGNVLHMVYTSGNWRERGVATQLMSSVFGDDFRGPGLTMTAWTRLVPAYRERWRLEYDPFPLYEVVSDIAIGRMLEDKWQVAPRWQHLNPEEAEVKALDFSGRIIHI